MFSSAVYVRSPARLQESLLSCRARVRRLLREGRAYRECLERVRHRESWSAEQLRGYQERKLRQLFECAQSSDYYARLFGRYGPELSALPYLSKQQVRDESLLTAVNKSSFTGHTSGTTGTPIAIVQDLTAIIRENAFIGRQLAWAGYKPGEPRAWIRGDMVVPVGRGGPFWRMNRAENMLMCSSYHLSEQSADAYIKALEKHRPKLIQAYPSSIAFLARYLEASNRYSNAGSVVTSSETLSDDDRRLIEDRFRCRVFDWYGLFERVAAIGTCWEGSYHLMSDYSLVEFEPAGERLEMIGTGFNNFLMPLIRYRTGDFVEMSDKSCGCGMAFPVVDRIYGRKEDYIKLRDGRKIGRLDHIFKGLSNIAEGQIVQDSLDLIRIRVVPLSGFDKRSESALLSNARERLGEIPDIQIDLARRIPRTRNGKFLSVICNV